MIRFSILLGSVVSAWLIHVGLVTTYMKLFANTHTIGFRIIYTLELALTFGIMLVIYLSKVSNPSRISLILLTTIGFLAIVDATLGLTLKSVRSNFDIYHFVTAYIVTALTLVVIYKFKIS